jgi:hypothetical protein
LEGERAICICFNAGEEVFFVMTCASDPVEEGASKEWEGEGEDAGAGAKEEGEGEGGVVGRLGEDNGREEGEGEREGAGECVCDAVSGRLSSGRVGGGTEGKSFFGVRTILCLGFAAKFSFVPKLEEGSDIVATKARGVRSFSIGSIRDASGGGA